LRETAWELEVAENRKAAGKARAGAQALEARNTARIEELKAELAQFTADEQDSAWGNTAGSVWIGVAHPENYAEFWQYLVESAWAARG
jgi:hypothetical protein